jgi:hypothetical protein
MEEFSRRTASEANNAGFDGPGASCEGVGAIRWSIGPVSNPNSDAAKSCLMKGGSWNQRKPW